MLSASGEMKEVMMLDLSSVDLEMLVEALEDHSPESTWWLDLATGSVECRFEFDRSLDDLEDLESRDVVRVEARSSRAGYQDMVDFTNMVGDARAGERLSRALQGRGAFRRFKDTLFDLPELRVEWFAFHDRRTRARAIEWLIDQDLVSQDAASEALDDLGEEPEWIGSLGAMGVAELATSRLRDLYGDRLVQVLLYGSQARGDADPDSDIDLLVVLRDMRSPWDELRRMDDLLWRLSFEHGVTLSALAVTEDEFENASRPVLIEARSEGMPMG
jgi:predicted nucleotidyltransferase